MLVRSLMKTLGVRVEFAFLFRVSGCQQYKNDLANITHRYLGLMKKDLPLSVMFSSRLSSLLVEQKTASTIFGKERLILRF